MGEEFICEACQRPTDYTTEVEDTGFCPRCRDFCRRINYGLPPQRHHNFTHASEVFFRLGQITAVFRQFGQEELEKRIIEYTNEMVEVYHEGKDVFNCLYLQPKPNSAQVVAGLLEE